MNSFELYLMLQADNIRLLSWWLAPISAIIIILGMKSEKNYKVSAFDEKILRLSIISFIINTMILYFLPQTYQLERIFTN